MVHPANLPSRARDVLGRYPTVVVIPLAWLWVLTDPVAIVFYLVSVGLLTVAVGLEAGRVRHDPDRPLAGLVPGLVFLAAVGCLRQAGAGLASGVGILALVPVFQAALFGRRRTELWAMLAAEAALYLAPVLLVGGPDYPHTQYRAGLLTVAVSTAVGLATHALVARVRCEADEAEDSRGMLAQVSRLVHDLFASADVRCELTAGTVRIAGASLAILFEPDDDACVLRCTAVTGLSLGSVEIPVRAENPIGAAFLSGRATLVRCLDERELAAPEIWRACGRPEAVLYQPLVRDGESVGVFAVAWQNVDVLSALAARASAVELLAHEAALVLDRADEVTLLTGMAQTDPLTGLPNRRAWDDHVAHALREGRGITVALLDIDHFKRFNDAHGHPAGDRLLRETAAAWRDLLRGDDLLARLGGEEFGLLLLDCGPRDAVEVTERLRAAMTGGQTCSAGLARRDAAEPFESVVARADAALYEAKAAGRDLARVAA